MKVIVLISFVLLFLMGIAACIADHPTEAAKNVCFLIVLYGIVKAVENVVGPNGL